MRWCSCGVAGIHGRWSTSAVLRRVATRVLVVATIGMALVPASVWVSQRSTKRIE
ncbi:MAG: hypothetical protein ACLTYW_04065 [Collinsella sp.]